MLGLVFTTPHEAVPFLNEHTGLRPEALEIGSPVQVGNLLVAATGPGKINATLETERLLETYDLNRVLHAGTCTGVSEDVSPGSVVGASFVLEGDRVALEDPAYPRMPLECPLDVDVEGTLVSQDYSAASAEASDDSDAPSSLSYWERLADVRDGTGYAVVYVAGQHGTPCYIVKGVSSHRDITQQPSEPSAGSSRHAVASVLGRFLQESANDG